MIRQKRKSKLARTRAKLRSKSRPTPRPGRRRRNAFAARLTIDVTPDLRGRIKITAFHRGVTVAYMLRALLLKNFPQTKRGRR